MTLGHLARTLALKGENQDEGKWERGEVRGGDKMEEGQPHPQALPIKKEGPWDNYQQRPVESREEGWSAEGEGEPVPF